MMGGESGVFEVLRRRAQALLPHPALVEEPGLFLICLPPHGIVNFTVSKKDKA